MVATALLVAFSISASFAQTLTLTGALNSSSVSCAILSGYTTLNIGDGTIATTWIIDNDLDLSACSNPIIVVLNNNAVLHINNSRTLSLPAGSIIKLLGTGYVWKEAPCSASQIIYIGSIKIASCNGGGGGNPLNTFDQINGFGGTGNASSNSPVCTGNTINLAAIPSIPGYTYLWTGPSGETYNTQNITLPSATILMADLYKVEITNTTGNSVTAVTTVVVAPSITNSIGGGTSPICSGSTPAILTGVPTGGNGIYNPYLWESSTSSSTTGFSPATGINNAQTYQPGALTQTTWFRRSVTSGCTDISAPIEIIVTPTVGTPVFALGATSDRDQGIGTITYKAIADNSTGITYTLSPASAGTFIESAAGLAVTYSSLWNGTCTITATATGCGGSKSEIHTVSTNWCYALFTVNGALSCAGASTIDGHIGTLVGAITGFTPPGLTPPGYSGPGILSASSRLDPQATTNSVQAATQVVTAYNDLAAMPCSADPPLGTTLAADQTFTPKVYCTGGALTINTNVKITLDGAGIYIFKVNGALTTDIGSIIEVKNGADYRNVYWQVAGAVVLSGSEFIGTIINDGAITINTGAALNGRALSISGAIALTTNVVTSNCYPLISLPNNTIPTFVPPGDITGCVENIFTAVYNSATIDINPDRPDFYNLLNTDKRLDLNTASFIDNPDVPGCPFEIRWKIDMNDGTRIPALPSSYNIGQPSAYGDIKFLGDGIGDGTNFADVTHTITYWIVDCAGIVSLPQTRTITIKPRPYIQKTTL